MAGRTFKRASRLIPILIGIAVASAGCTASVTKAGSSNWNGPLGGSETVNLAAGSELSLPAGFVEQVSEATGVRLNLLPFDEPTTWQPGPAGSQIPIDVGGKPVGLYLGPLVSTQDAPRAVLVGDGDACVLADKAWYSANKLAAPTDLESLGEDVLLEILGASDPDQGNLNAANMALWVKQLEDLDGQAAQSNDSDAAQSGEPGPPPVIQGRIGSSLEPLREETAGLAARYQVVDGTCAAVSTYVVPVADTDSRAVKLVIDFLSSDEGTALLAEHSVIYPLTGTVAGQKPASVAITQDRVGEAAELWVEAFR